MLLPTLLAALPSSGGASRAAHPRHAGWWGLPGDRVVLAPQLARALYHLSIPSFSRQTRLPCAACHYQFPELTPFGRLFKLNGYTLTGLTVIQSQQDTSQRPTLALAPIPPAAAMVVVSLTSERRAQPGTQNNTAVFPQEASLFLAGEVTPRIGAFTQFTYAAPDGTFGIDNVDFRYANHTTYGGRDLLYGLTLHNNPTVQDVWNTVPAWGYPFMGSEVAPSPMASTLIDGALGQQVLGLGAYGLWSNTLYTEGTVYRSAPQLAGGPLDSTAADVTRGVIPYWRVALQHQFGIGYLMVGTFGMDASLYPTGVTGPTDHYTDLAADAQFERGTGPAGGVVILRASWIHERQRLRALFAQGAAQNADNDLSTLRASATYDPGQRLGMTLGWFGTTGTRDTLLYAPAPVAGSGTGSPNSSGAIAEVVFNPWQNTRLGVQYVAYTKFNGASSGYDAAGRSASDNDTLYLYTWIAF